MPTEWLQRSTADLLVVLMPDLPSGESCSFGNPRSAFCSGAAGMSAM
jgi:hypothetical protein